jgi:hypothetical protein
MTLVSYAWTTSGSVALLSKPSSRNSNRSEFEVCKASSVIIAVFSDSSRAKISSERMCPSPQVVLTIERTPCHGWNQ